MKFYRWSLLPKIRPSWWFRFAISSFSSNKNFNKWLRCEIAKVLIIMYLIAEIYTSKGGNLKYFRQDNS